MEKVAVTDHPIHSLLASRWSPYCFEDRNVPDADLRSLFEAARWAPSSYNEQPWSYLVATRRDREAFARLLSCLVERTRKPLAAFVFGGRYGEAAPRVAGRGQG